MAMDGRENGIVDAERVEDARGAMLSHDAAMALSAIFDALGDPTRLRMVSALEYGELPVGQLADVLEMSLSAVSHQLRLLRNLRVVKSRREGRHVYYSLDDEHVANMYRYALAHLRHS